MGARGVGTIGARGVGTMGAGGVGTMGARGLQPPIFFYHFSQCLPDHILIKLLYCT